MNVCAARAARLRDGNRGGPHEGPAAPPLNISWRPGDNDCRIAAALAFARDRVDVSCCGSTQRLCMGMAPTKVELLAYHGSDNLETLVDSHPPL